MLAIAVTCLIWYLTIVVVCSIGIFQLYYWYSSPVQKPSFSASQGQYAPRVTIIRPAKGLDARLYDCLASTFHQDYPREKLTVYFCVDSESDAAVPALRQLIADFPAFDAHLMIETQDPVLQQHGLGPNPKIRSMSRAYREAQSDVIWIIDCNVWVNRGTCGRMVDTLYGYNGSRPNKFVHQLPLVVDISPVPRTHTDRENHAWRTLGGRFEETWFSAAHAKFYTAINTVLVAPCIVGKSNMFRKSHLNALTKNQGIDYFSHNICEDHLIGDLLWYKPLPDSVRNAWLEDTNASKQAWGNHALDFGDLAIQPVSNMSISEFFHRRVRWLRVRKFTVMLATLVEPGTESILCSLYGAYAISSLPYFHERFSIPPTWTTFILFFLLSMTVWASVDWILYNHMHSGRSVQRNDHMPQFARFEAKKRRNFREWIVGWAGREVLAFPIWAWAIWGGVTVAWRGKSFRVGINMRVTEIREPDSKINGSVDSDSKAHVH